MQVLPLRRGWLVVAFSLAAFVVAASEPIYQAPDEVAERLTPVQTLQRAQAFLAEHPTAPAAARAAFDQLLAASSLKEAELADRAKAALLLDYPFSLQAEFVTAAFKEDDEFCKLMVRDFVRRDRVLDRTYLEKFVVAAKRAPEAARTQIAKDQKYAVAFAFAAQMLVDNRKIDWKDRLAPSVLPLVQAVTNNTDNRQAWFLSLEKWPQNEVVQAIQRAVFQRLQARERSAEVFAVQLENLIFGGRSADALELIATIPTDRHSPRVRYWTAFVLAGAERFDDALAALEPHENDAEGDPWSAGAAELRKHLQSLPTALAETPVAVQAALDELRTNPPTAIEGVIAAKGAADDSRNEVYFASDSSRAAIEFTYRRNDEFQFGYRCEGRTGTIYFPGLKKIREHASGRYLPDIRWWAGEGPSGKVDYRFSFKFTDEIRDNLSALVEPLQAKPEAFDAVALRKLFVGWVADRTLIAPPTVHGDERRITLFAAERGSPKLSPTTLRLSADGKLLGFDTDGLSVTRLKYGRSGDFEFTPHAWPDLPVEKSDVMSPSDFIQLFTAAMTEFERWSGPKKEAK